MPIQESHSATLDRLESELNSVLEQDSRYWTENDAKFRAVAQNVSYEQFEEIVKASPKYIIISKQVYYDL